MTSKKTSKQFRQIGFHTKQKKIIEALKSYDQNIANVYIGGIKTLGQDYVEKIPQAAHSFRECVILLSRLKEVKEFGFIKSEKPNKSRFEDLIRNLDHRATRTEPYALHRKLLDMRNYFSGVAHHHEYQHVKFQKKVTEFEELLIQILKPHFDVIKEINNLLRLEIPRQEDFEELRPLLSRNVAAYNYFFQNASAGWMPILLKEGYLKEPEHIVYVGKERRIDGLSIASYLSKCAKIKPDEVSEIILGFKTPEKDKRASSLLNLYVDACINMPPEYCRAIVMKIFREDWLDIFSNESLSTSVSKLIKKLSDAGFEKETNYMVKAMLNTKLGEKHVLSGIQKPKQIQNVKPVIGNYAFEKFLTDEMRHTFKKFPESITNLCVERINRMIDFENQGKGEKESKTDTSWAWRPAIENHTQNPSLDFRSLLVGSLGENLIELGNKSIPVLERVINNSISKIKRPVFRRLELYIYYSFPDHFKSQINHAIEGYFDKYELQYEYFHLLEKCFQYASKETRGKYLTRVRDIADTEFNKSHAANKLAPVQKHLTEKEKEEFKDLINQKGSPYPDFSFYSLGVRMSKPKTELKEGLSAEEVFKFIKNYPVEKQKSFGYYDGTSEKFQTYVSENSENFSNLALKCISLDYTLKHSFFAGIENAVKQEKKIEWEPVLLLCKEIIESIKKEQENFYVVLPIVCALKKGMEYGSIDFIFRNQVWNLLSSLTIMHNDNLLHKKSLYQDEYVEESEDAFASSENTSDGVTFHSVMEYVMWCDRHSTKAKFFDIDAKKLITEYLEHKISTTRNRQAVLGHYLSILNYYDKNWLKKRLPNLFKNHHDELSNAAWQGYLMNMADGEIFKDLARQYEIHVEKLKTPSLKDGNLQLYDERVIAHITVSYLLQMKGSQDIFFKMIKQLDPNIGAYCSFIVWTMLEQHKKKPMKSFSVRRFKNLWKNNFLTNNNKLRQWLEYSPLDKKESLKLFYNSLQTSTKSIVFLANLEEFEQYAETYPLLTFKCLDLIIRQRAMDDDFYIFEEQLNDLLKKLLAKNITKRDTTSLIHYLDEIGYNKCGEML